ncbi:MAG TPA: cbb3-type cytochrome c oxidase subunit II [Kofleriaceae bacterium]|nr:cbb3-type cytochrome c oxidase subunit II [Kofleriaceae bacterium]
MTRIALLLVGAVAILVFAIVILVIVPATSLEDITPSAKLKPYAGTVALGRLIYVREGCVYCHSQQVRDPAFTNDERRGWGRPSVMSDYAYDKPHLLGTMRTGPDLLNVATRLPDRKWHLIHLYQPRLVAPWSVMPSFRYLFVVKDRADPLDEVVTLPSGQAPAGKLVVATAEASALVDYLLSLDRSFPPALSSVQKEP